MYKHRVLEYVSVNLFLFPRVHSLACRCDDTALFYFFLFVCYFFLNRSASKVGNTYMYIYFCSYNCAAPYICM